MLGKWSWQPSHFERHSKAGIRIYKWEQFCRTSSKAVCRKRTDKHTNTHAHTHTQTHTHTHTHTHTNTHKHVHVCCKGCFTGRQSRLVLIKLSLSSTALCVCVCV